MRDDEHGLTVGLGAADLYPEEDEPGGSYLVVVGVPVYVSGASSSDAQEAAIGLVTGWLAPAAVRETEFTGRGIHAVSVEALGAPDEDAYDDPDVMV